MDRYASPLLFAADVAKQEGPSTAPAYEITTAERAGFKEAWLQSAIANEPELIISACRKAGLTDERWWLEQRQAVHVDVNEKLRHAGEPRITVRRARASSFPRARPGAASSSVASGTRRSLFHCWSVRRTSQRCR